MVYDTPTFVANYLRQSSLYNPTWNTQKHLIFFQQIVNKYIYETSACVLKPHIAHLGLNNNYSLFHWKSFWTTGLYILNGHDCMVVGFITTSRVQLVPITTKVMSLNPAHGEVFLQHGVWHAYLCCQLSTSELII
jgi:hypothetical protein